MSHPFGNAIRRHLSRKQGLSQHRMAQDLDLDDAVISDMCHGQRLTGKKARQRVMAILTWLYDHGTLESLAEANALLQAAGMAKLDSDPAGECRLLLALSASAPAVGASPGQVVCSGNLPALPTLLIGRDQALADLKARLRRTVDPARRAQRVVVVRGWPGVGKTTLAAALAHEPDLGDLFPDGVLWCSLGTTPDLLAELAAWGRALGVDDLEKCRRVEEASARLAALLRDRRMLLIIDDVWEMAHALPFRVGGARCAVVVTTRLPAVAAELAVAPSDVYPLPVLTEMQALEVLSTLAPTVVEAYPHHALELVRELECLPLALHVAGRMLQAEAHLDWNVLDLLTELGTGVRLLVAQAPAELSSVARETRPRITVLLSHSTARLDPRARECFTCLAGFAPRPRTFDIDALRSAWRVRDPRPMIRTLVNGGLLEPAGAERLQMHALLVLHAQSLLMEMIE